MAENFDPYLQWLGIRDPQRPPNYYRLLGVELFESDPIVLTNAVDRQMAHVRNFQSGKHSAESQKLLNELAAAKLCLLNAQRKAQYDLQLQAQQAAAPMATPPGPGSANAPAAAGLWPSAPRPAAVPQPTPPVEPAEVPPPGGPPALPSTSNQSSLFSVAVSVLVALILILLGLIVVMATRRRDEPPPVSIDQPQPETQPEVEPGPEVKPEVKPGPEAKPQAKPETKPETKPKPEEKPAVKPETKPEVKPKPEPKTETVEESLAAARAAMVDRDIEAARRRLDRAHDATVMGSPEAEQVQHLSAVLDDLERFATALDEGIESLKAGDQLSGGKTPVTVAGVADGKVTLKVGDAEQAFTAANLPAWIALTVASRKLPSEGREALEAKAAFLIFDPQGDLQQAEQFCIEAAKSGQLKTELATEYKKAFAERGERKTEEPAPVPVAAKPQRLPVPDEATQTKVLATIHELFAKEYAAAEENPEEKKKLAKVLLGQAPETEDNPAARYVLLAEARNLAIDAGDSYLLEKALRDLDRVFEIDRHAMAAELMTEAAKRSRTSAANRTMAQTSLKLAQRASAEDRFGSAGELIEAAIAMARRASDTDTVKKAVAAKRTLEELQGRHKSFTAAAEVLQENPDDPTANLIRGSYLCFVKGNWEQGLPLLAKGEDPSLAAVAKAELEPPPTDPDQLVASRVSLGDRWWDAAGSASAGENREKYRDRAAFWYQKVLEDLSGLTRVKVQHRLDELKP